MLERWLALWAQPLAVEGTPVWATILVAVLSGLLGLFSGAAAAAIVTTRAERVERFRERMIVAADDFVAKLVKSFRVLDDVWQDFEMVALALNDAKLGDTRGLDELQRNYAIEAPIAPTGTGVQAILSALKSQTDDRLKAADRTVAALEDALPRLDVVFRDRRIAAHAVALRSAIREWLFEMRQMADSGERLSKGLVSEEDVYRAIRQALNAVNESWSRRDEFLSAVGEAVRTKNP